jgi:hypothetical protein
MLVRFVPGYFFYAIIIVSAYCTVIDKICNYVCVAAVSLSSRLLACLSKCCSISFVGRLGVLANFWHTLEQQCLSWLYNCFVWLGRTICEGRTYTIWSYHRIKFKYFRDFLKVWLLSHTAPQYSKANRILSDIFEEDEDNVEWKYSEKHACDSGIWILKENVCMERDEYNF